MACEVLYGTSTSYATLYDSPKVTETFHLYETYTETFVDTYTFTYADTDVLCVLRSAKLAIQGLG